MRLGLLFLCFTRVLQCDALYDMMQSSLSAHPVESLPISGRFFCFLEKIPLDKNIFKKVVDNNILMGV